MSGVLPTKDQPQKPGGAQQAGEQTDRYLRRRRHGAGQGVGQQKQDRAGQQRAGDQSAMVRSQPQAHQVRHHQADKADDSADGHRGGHQHRTAQQQPALQHLHVDPKIVRLFIAKLQQIEAGRHPPHRQRRRDNQGRGHQQRRPFGLAQTAHSPQRQLAQLGVIAQPGQDADQRAAQRVDGDPHQQQARQRTFLRPTEDENHHHHRQAANKRRQHRHIQGDQPRSGEREHQPAGHRQRGAAADAQQARVGKRVAKQPLHHAAGEGQRRAHQQGQQHPRQTDGQPDMAQHVIPGRQQVDQRQAHGAEGGGKQRQGDQQQRHQQQTASEGRAHQGNCSALFRSAIIACGVRGPKPSRAISSIVSSCL